MVLQTWLLADVTSTNVLAHDPAAALEALRRPGGVRRLVRVKVAALAVLIGPPCALLAVVLGLGSDRPVRALILAPVFLALPFGVPAVASWLGVLLPYRPRSLRWRWRHRRPWRRSIRWAFLVLAPYSVVPAVLTALIVSAKLAGDVAIGGQFADRSAPLSAIAVMSGSATLASLALFVAGTVVANRLAQARRDRLVGWLRDPDAG